MVRYINVEFRNSSFKMRFFRGKFGATSISAFKITLINANDKKRMLDKLKNKPSFAANLL